MKTYAVLQVLSTGYISGTIPPQFNENNKQPIDMCGTDSIVNLDGRKSIYNLQDDVRTHINKIRRSDIVKFRIVKTNDFLRNERVIYTSENLF